MSTQQYKPTIEIDRDEATYWAAQFARIADGAFPYPFREIPNSLRAEVRKSRLLLTAALHHAAGKDVKMRAENGRTPSETQSLTKFRAAAKGVDDLLERCKAAAKLT